MERSDGGMRMFTEDDFEWFRFIERLKKSGMPLKEIKEFIDLYEQGDSTIEQRRELIHARKKKSNAKWQSYKKRSISLPISVGITM